MNHPDLDRFLESLVVERGLRQNSLEAYQRDLIRYLAHLAGRGREATALDRTDVPRYLLTLREAGLNPRSVARHLSAIRQFHRFLVRQGQAAEDPTAHLEAPRPWRRLPGVLSSEEVDRLLAARRVTTPRELRNRAMLELMYASGLRVSELVGLRLGDVDLGVGIVRVVGKGDKERLVPVGDAAAESLQAYLRDGRPRLAKSHPSDYLFLGRHGRGLTRQMFWQLDQEGRPRRRHHHIGDTPHAAPFLCNPPAGTGGGPPFGPAHAGPRGHRHHADLHAPQPGPPEDDLRQVPPTGVTLHHVGAVGLSTNVLFGLAQPSPHRRHTA